MALQAKSALTTKRSGARHLCEATTCSTRLSLAASIGCRAAGMAGSNSPNVSSVGWRVSLDRARELSFVDIAKSSFTVNRSKFVTHSR